MSIVSIMLIVFSIPIVAIVVLFWKRATFCDEDIMLAFGIAVFTIGCVIMSCGVAHKLAHEQFCEKFQIDDKHTDFYRNNAESPVLVHVATYGTFSGEREQTVIVPPGQVRYFGHGKVLWVDSE